MKALERQFGADVVQLDTVDSWARCYLKDAKNIQFENLDPAARAAGYTLTKVDIEARGKVIEAPCATCKVPDKRFLVLAGTDQRVELAGNATASPAARVTGQLVGWSSDHPVIVVESQESLTDR